MRLKFEGDCGLWILKEIIKKNQYPENMKKKKNSWEPFGSYLLNSTANPQFEWKWAGLAVLFSR